MGTPLRHTPARFPELFIVCVRFSTTRTGTMGVDSPFSSPFPSAHARQTPCCCPVPAKRGEIAVGLGAGHAAHRRAARCGAAVASDVERSAAHAPPRAAQRSATGAMAGGRLEPDRAFQRCGCQTQPIQANAAASFAGTRFRPARHPHPGATARGTLRSIRATAAPRAKLPICCEGPAARTAQPRGL